MAANALTEDLGPIALRRIRVANVVSIIALAGLAVLALLRLGSRGQLAADKWVPLVTDERVRQIIIDGLVGTILAAMTAMVIALVFGFALALMRLSRNRVVRAVALSYVEVFRALPLLLVIFLFALALPRIGIELGIFWSLVAALVTYNSATLSEIFRAGINSLDKGQTEAAQAIGMSYWQQMFIVVLPQAVRRMVPAIVAQLATLTKDVSLGFVISYEEVVRKGQNIAQSQSLEVGNLQAYFFVGVIYFILIWLIARLADYLEGRQGASSRSASMVKVKGDKDAPMVDTEIDIA